MLPIDPRIAARWLSVRQERSRKLWRVLVGILISITALAGAWVAARSPLLAVRHVVIAAGAHTDARTVASAAGLARRPPMLDLNLGAIRARVLALPWVARVGVQRRWPNTVAIEITERTPAAVVVGGDGHRSVVDASGRVLAVGSEAAQLEARQVPALPALVGLPARVAPGSWLGPGADGALAVLHALTGARLDQEPTPMTVTTISQSANGALSVVLSSSLASARTPVTVIFGSATQLSAKVSALRLVLAQLAPGSPATIDVQVADVPVLTNGNKSTIVSTTQRG